MSLPLYRVELDIFQGPLDLLLYLVERQELDVFDFPIAKITASFIEFLEVLELIDLDLVGDFVVMASALVEIKSRQMLPQAEEEDQTVEIAGDPRGELIQQLLQYKKYKDASKLLEEQAALWQERYPRLSDDRPRQGKDPSADFIKDVELWDLVSAPVAGAANQHPRTARQHPLRRYADFRLCGTHRIPSSPRKAGIV